MATLPVCGYQHSSQWYYAGFYRAPNKAWAACDCLLKACHHKAHILCVQAHVYGPCGTSVPAGTQQVIYTYILHTYVLSVIKDWSYEASKGDEGVPTTSKLRPHLPCTPKSVTTSTVTLLEAGVSCTAVPRCHNMNPRVQGKHMLLLPAEAWFV